jgi:ADP-ribosyl-[dinitrogen reductase] hydrolase
MKLPIPNSYWVEPGRFLAGEHPSGDTYADTEKRLRRLVEAGIDCFIDLTQPEERPAYRDLLPAHVRYHNLPLVDHAAPEDPSRLRGILATLDDALGEGRGVYLHCRAGIGRTGVTVGCHLVEAGERPDAALETLNTLWQQNARARHWPRVPETEDQEAFILRWRARGSAATDLASRAQGALVGLAVGDALALSTQGRKPGEFAPVTGPAGGGQPPLPPGTWTDDTAMTLCVAESLLASRGFDARDQMERYRRWQQDGHLSATGKAVGLRPAVRRALALAGWRRAPVVGSHDPAQLEPEPLVRCIAPALYFHRDFNAAVEAGADTARVTHQAPLVVDACRLFTGMLHGALAGEPREAVLALAGRWPGTPLKPEILRHAEGWNQPPRRRASRNATILTVLDDVVRAFADSEDYAPGLLGLVNRGGESDVAGAAYGQLAGAFYGLAAIPPAWRDALPAASLLERFADQLLKGPSL